MLEIDHTFLGQDFWNSIEWYISGVVMHDLTVYTHTLLPLPCKMLWLKYDAHMAWLYFYMFHICDLIFPQTFCFEHFGFDPWVFLNNDHAMIVTMNVYFFKIQNTHNNTWPFILMIFLNWGGNNERNVLSLIMILFSEYLATLSPSYYVSLTRML